MIGDYAFPCPLEEGDLVIFGDMAIYTTCKNNTFNGMPLPTSGAWDAGRPDPADPTMAMRHSKSGSAIEKDPAHRNKGPIRQKYPASDGKKTFPPGAGRFSASPVQVIQRFWDIHAGQTP